MSSRRAAASSWARPGATPRASSRLADACSSWCAPPTRRTRAPASIPARAAAATTRSSASAPLIRPLPGTRAPRPCAPRRPGRDRRAPRSSRPHGAHGRLPAPTGRGEPRPGRAAPTRAASTSSGPAASAARAATTRARTTADASPPAACAAARGASTRRSKRSRRGPLIRAAYAARRAGGHVHSRSGSPAMPHGQGFMAATTMQSAGSVTAPCARARCTRRSSSGIRRPSRAGRVNSGSSSMKSTPPCARLTSPGRRRAFPISAATDALWCGARNGRERTSVPGARSPAAEWMRVISSDSPESGGGRMPGRRRASIVLPDPGGPVIRRLWRPAAAISSARRARG